MPVDMNRWENLTKEEIWVLEAWGRGELTRISPTKDTGDEGPVVSDKKLDGKPWHGTEGPISQ